MHSIRKLGILAVVMAAAHGPAVADELTDRGAYLLTIMGCGDCHTGGMLMGQPDPERYLAGSEVGFEMPGLGIFYPKNLTPDEATGLGLWTEEELVRVLTTGIRPDGRQLAPIMPWMNTAQMAPDDLAAVVAYLRAMPPVSFQVPDDVPPGTPPVAPYMTVVVP